MGYVEIIKNGKLTRIEGGEKVYENVDTFVCDNCQETKAVFGSEILSSDGLSLLQFCDTCKRMTQSEKLRRINQIKAEK